MDIILSHSAIYQCPFANWNLVYPEDIQDQMDMKALEEREHSLIERRKAALEAFAKQEKEINAKKMAMAKKKGEE
jgi:hypothetical protein